MHITYLELENIKSYHARTRVDLTSGLNAICGSNGSGKTTILEAIGYVLFNSLQYSQKDFVREGEKNGTIRVGLVVKDERQYEIVRRVGSSGGYFVFDPEGQSRICEGAPEVSAWIRQQALDTDDDVNLSDLFENAIGVPQGLITSDFLKSAGTRKNVFDPLLRVEEYRTAWEYLRETVNYLRARDAEVGESIARLETETDRIPDLKVSADDLRRQQAEAVEHFDRLVMEVSALNAQKIALDDLQTQVVALQGEVRGCEYEVHRVEDRLRAGSELLDRSKAARASAAEAEPGYKFVVEARKRLHSLESRVRERDDLRQKHNDAQAQAKGIFGQIQALDKRRAECEQAAEDAAALVDVVRQQEELEARRQELAVELRDRGRLDIQISKLLEATNTLQRACDTREPRIGTAGVARARSEQLPATQDALQRVSDELGTLRPLHQQLTALTDEGKQLRERSDRLSADVEQGTLLRQQIAALASSAGKLDELLVRQSELRDRRAGIRATLEYQAVARTELRREQCPLLELRCPVVTADVRLLERFDQRDDQLVNDAHSIDLELAALEGDVVVTRAATTELQRLQVEEAALSRSAEDLVAVQEDLDRCRNQYKELSDALKQEKPLTDEQGRLQNEVRALQEAMRVAAELPLLQQQDASDREALDLQRGELADLEKQRSDLTLTEEAVRALDAELQNLGNPKEQQHRWLTIASAKATVVTETEQRQVDLTEESGRVKALTAALLPFDTIDADMDEQRKIVADHSENHDRYLRVRDDAALVEERQKAVVIAEGELKTGRAAWQQAKLKYEEAAASYDADRHQLLRVECDATTRELGAADARVKNAQAQLADVERELVELRRLEAKLRKQRGERDELARVARAITFIRSTINAAGPAVTEQLLKNISYGANDIYAEIMDDHAVELRWDRDYEVIVQRGAEERKFVQLSGGEQMSAALAVRLALLKEMSEVDFAFFDEPTQNMDVDRRGNLADQIRQVRGFDQLIVISHDDTFEHHTDNLIRLKKEHEETVVE